MGRCKDVRKADTGRKMRQCLEHLDWDCTDQSKHIGARHPQYKGVLFFSHGRVSIGVNRQIVRVLVGLGMAGLLLALIYTYM